MTAPSTYIDRARELTEFCLAHGGKCFTGWPVKTLFEYCFFHLFDRGAFFVRAHGRLVALMFAWGIPVDEIRQTHLDKQAAFQWRRSRNHVDGIFLAEVLGDRRRLPKLFKLAAAKWPDWKSKRIFTYRSGQLVELAPALIKRMIQGAMSEKVSESVSEQRPPTRSLTHSPAHSIPLPACPDTSQTRQCPAAQTVKGSS